MVKKITYKNSFMGREFPELPERCQNCFGFSNWSGDREALIYEERDCDNCLDKPAFAKA